MLSFTWVDPYIVWVVPVRIKPLNGAVSVLGWTSRVAAGQSIATTPLPAAPTFRGGENRDRSCPEKAVGHCNICQDVVTCWCWRATVSKVLLLFKWLVMLIWRIVKFTRCYWKLKMWRSMAIFLYTYLASSDFYKLCIVKNCLCCRTFPQLMPSIP